MSEVQFGERYFATRERLASVMVGIAALARETSTDLGDRLPVSAASEPLGNPFLFVVCGEVNAGKSSLINGLFGREICRVNVLPETDRVLWYRYGPTAKNVPVTPLLEERYRPVDFLRDFNLIDTPGTNSAVAGHQEITGRFLPNADLILFVFPVTNPWGAATWNFISALAPDLLEKVVFIVQQADQREPGDIGVILGHMADLSMKRIGRVPHMFAVSGKLALEAKRAAPPAARKLKQSGLPALEDFISRNICQSGGRRHVLEGWRAQAATALREVEDRIEDHTRGLSGHTRFLDGVEREIHGIRETFAARLPSRLARVAEVFEFEALHVARLLGRHLSPLPSFLRIISGDRTGHEIEEIFLTNLKTAVLKTAGTDGDEVVAACRAHWETLTGQVREEMSVDIPTAMPIPEMLAGAREKFVGRIGAATTRGIGNLNVRNRLDKNIRRRNLALKSFSIATLLPLIAGSVCGALRIPWLPWIFCAAALLFALGGIAIALLTRTRIRNDFRHQLLDTCGRFAATLHQDYEEALRIVFREYAASLDPLRTRLAQEKLAIEPRLKRWQELFLTLKAIEQDL